MAPSRTSLASLHQYCHTTEASFSFGYRYPSPAAAARQVSGRSEYAAALYHKIGPFCLLVVLFTCASMSQFAAATDFTRDFVVNWAPDNVKYLNGGQELQLVLDENTGAGFASRDSYLFGRIDMQIKLVPGDSAGTVTAYYLSSETANHDELDFEFLGNTTGEPYILQTNVFSNGKGEREQRIYLWFDPSADFHTYTILWNRQRILFMVDETPIRSFANNEVVGVPYLSQQHVRAFSSIWNGDSWATRGGLTKIDWSNAPFVASYTNFRVSPAPDQPSSADDSAQLLSKLLWVQSNFMVYDYCTDHARYSVPPAECTRQV